MWFVASDGYKEFSLIGKVSLGCPTFRGGGVVVLPAGVDGKEAARESELSCFLHLRRPSCYPNPEVLACKVPYESEAFLRREKKKNLFYRNKLLVSFSLCQCKTIFKSLFSFGSTICYIMGSGRDIHDLKFQAFF